MALARWKKRILFAGVLVFLVGILASVFLPPWLHARRLNNLLAEFQANPSQATADPLIAMLIRSELTDVEGERVLAAIFATRAVVDDYYPSGSEITFEIMPVNPTVAAMLKGNSTISFSFLNNTPQPYSGLFPGRYTYVVHVDGVSDAISQEPNKTGAVFLDESLSGIFRDAYRWVELEPIRIGRPGTYHGTVSVSYSLSLSEQIASMENLVKEVKSSPLERLLKKLGLGGQPSPTPKEYHCRLEVPFTVVIKHSTTTTASSGYNDRMTRRKRAMEPPAGFIGGPGPGFLPGDIPGQPSVPGPGSPMSSQPSK
jgi:hypothetical protein